MTYMVMAIFKMQFLRLVTLDKKKAPGFSLSNAPVTNCNTHIIEAESSTLEKPLHVRVGEHLRVMRAHIGLRPVFLEGSLDIMAPITLASSALDFSCANQAGNNVRMVAAGNGLQAMQVTHGKKTASIFAWTLLVIGLSLPQGSLVTAFMEAVVGGLMTALSSNYCCRPATVS